MRFSSPREFFYKLYNVLYVIVLLPLLLFGFLYLNFRSEDLLANHNYSVASYMMILSAYGAIVGYSFWMFWNKIKLARRHSELNEKMEQYAKLTIARYVILAFTGLLLAAGLFLTKDQIFVVLFVVSLIVLSLVWPTSRKVSKDLKLRNEERETVLGRGRK